MKISIFYEHQLPRPWTEADEHRLFQGVLDQVELADKLGIDYAWDMWANFEKARHALPPAGTDHGIGTPDQLRTHLRHFEDPGIDQTVSRHQNLRDILTL
jgi:hypothetical protein